MPKHDQYDGISIPVYVSHREHTGPALLRKCILDDSNQVGAYVVTANNRDFEVPLGCLTKTQKLKAVP